MGQGSASGPGGQVSGQTTGNTDSAAGGATLGITINGPQGVPTPAILPIEADFLNALSTTAFATGRANSAESYIEKLGELAAALVPPTISPVYPTNVNAPAITAPIAPAITPIVYVPPQVPTPFSAVAPVTGNFPKFDLTPPVLAFPNAPAAPNLQVPMQPGIDLNFDYPTVNVQLPAPPALLSIDVKKFDGVTFPKFTATAPTLTAIQPRVVSYIPNGPYTDALLSELTLSLRTRLEIGNTGVNTGLPPAVEQNIWNRGREREYKQQADAIAALDRMESMGYEMPPGVWLDAQIKIQTETHYTMAGQSREIAIAQAKLEQDNISKALEISSDIEGKLIAAANEAEQRRFDATKYATEAGVQIYNAEVQAYGSLVNAFRAQVDVYNAQIQAARAIVDVYTAEIQAEKLKVDANGELVQQYQVMVNAALASIEVFKGEISIVQTRAQIENLKVSIFGEQVRAYSAQANVYTAQVEGYKAAVEAEGQKEQAYATGVNAYGSLVDATAKEIAANVEVYKAQLAAKQEEYDAYKAQVEGQAEQVRAIAASNSAVADIYRATVSGVSSYNDAMIKEWEASINLAEQVTQIGVQAAQANGNLYLTAKSIATDAAKVGAQVEAQIAASALGAVTWATHRARQDSVSFSQGNNFAQQKSQSEQASNSTGNNTSTSKSDSTSLQVSVGSSASENHNVASSE